MKPQGIPAREALARLHAAGARFVVDAEGKLKAAPPRGRAFTEEEREMMLEHREGLKALCEWDWLEAGRIMGRAVLFALSESGTKLCNEWDAALAAAHRSGQMGELRRCCFEMMAAARRRGKEPGLDWTRKWEVA